MQISEYERKLEDKENPVRDVSPEKLKGLQDTIQKLQKELREKKDKILQLEKSLLDLQSMVDKKGHFLRGSNLNDLYK